MVGILDDELLEFDRLRHALGSEAEKVIQECERLNSMFALSLRPTPPKPATKQRLLDMIQGALGKPKPISSDGKTAGS